MEWGRERCACGDVLGHMGEIDPEDVEEVEEPPLEIEEERECESGKRNGPRAFWDQEKRKKKSKKKGKQK